MIEVFPVCVASNIGLPIESDSGSVKVDVLQVSSEVDYEFVFGRVMPSFVGVVESSVVLESFPVEVVLQIVRIDAVDIFHDVIFHGLLVLDVVQHLPDGNEVVFCHSFRGNPENLEASIESNVLEIGQIVVQIFVLPVVDEFFRKDDLVTDAESRSSSIDLDTRS